MVTAESLSKQFGGSRAVNRVSFEASPGEVFGLLGENGAGKTTTLRMLATVLVPSEGDARVAGYSVRTAPEQVRRRVGLLTAEPGLYERLSARENVAYFGRLHGMSEALLRTRTAELFEMLELSAVADKAVGSFSRGMRQKVCLARTFVHDPAVLLLDEPTSGLDVSSTRAVDEFILRERAAGKVIIFSSHIMSEVEKLCDRVAIIHRGEIIARGTLDQLKQGDRRARFEDLFLRLVGEAG